ncbi:MAG: hypothetical protein IJ832_05375 [Bacteroidaceae bacterium]|nr:hypothetical protein [Bacteroidaceae bacterium]
MKAKILTLILAAAALCGRATTVDNAPGEPPYNVLEAVGNLEDQYGDTSKKTIVTNRNGATGQLESSLTIIPFECPNGQGIMKAVKEAFEKDKDLATRWGLYEPGTKGIFYAYTGQKPNQFIWTRENTYQGYYFINTTNQDNPTLRDQVSVQWQIFGDNKIKGKIFLITSLRPDLVVKNDTTTEADPFSMFFPQLRVDTAAYNAHLDRSMTTIEAARERLDKADKRLDEVSARLDAYNRFPSHNYAGISGTALKLKAYKQLLEMQNKEINTLEQRYRDNSYNLSERRAINKRLRKLHKQAQKTSSQMQKLIMKMK